MLFSYGYGQSEIEKISLTFKLTLELEAFWLPVTLLTFGFGKNL